MKKALWKDSVKEIKNTYKRFLSILLMALLGVGFFVGIRAASPDMVDTIDTYYQQQKVYDIEVLSTLGLTRRRYNSNAANRRRQSSRGKFFKRCFDKSGGYRECSESP